ncbi:hypothetical protein Raf01_52760 [Rugosimonospora africana]|uniref:Uncharacterized protein n=1 Tax=Rugosimonospora africana TaxID=556532 RepID=A0A8J3QU26_9ACTN|nr:hypothetical protein Raf01_52760 [Rugosimonospora africana]
MPGVEGPSIHVCQVVSALADARVAGARAAVTAAAPANFITLRRLTPLMLSSPGSDSSFGVHGPVDPRPGPYRTERVTPAVGVGTRAASGT